MEAAKLIVVLILSLTMGFGIWYLVGWFLSNESNLFLWPTYGKIFFLIFGTSSSAGIIDNITENYR